MHTRTCPCGCRMCVGQRIGWMVWRVWGLQSSAVLQDCAKMCVGVPEHGGALSRPLRGVQFEALLATCASVRPTNESLRALFCV